MSWSRFFHRQHWDDERARELDAHLAIEIDDNIARGMSPREARDAARRKFGNITLVREEIYQMNTVTLLDSAWRDLRYGARLLRLNPGFAIVAILSLALGVGANTAIFQLLDAVRLRALPVRDPSQLVEVRVEQTKDGRTGQFSSRRPNLTNPLWEQIRDRQHVFSSVFAWSNYSFNLTTGGEARNAQGLWVSGQFFDGLGVPALVGRVLTENDDRRGCASPPVVLGYGFWQREFGGDPSAIGRTLTLDGHAYDIGGVTPAGFFGVEVGGAFDLGGPLCAEPFSRGARSALGQRDAQYLADIIDDILGRDVLEFVVADRAPGGRRIEVDGLHEFLGLFDILFRSNQMKRIQTLILQNDQVFASGLAGARLRDGLNVFQYLYVCLFNRQIRNLYVRGCDRLARLVQQRQQPFHPLAGGGHVADDQQVRIGYF